MISPSLLQRAKFTPLLLLSLFGGAFGQGNDCSNPTVFSPGTQTGTVMPNDPDYYELTVPDGMIITLVETVDTNDCVYTLWEPGCTVSLADSAAMGLNSIIWGNDTGAPVRVTVHAFHWPGTPPPPSSYSFDISLQNSPCQDDSFEDNNDCATAAGITAGSHTGLNLGIADEDDFYEIQVPAGMQVTMVETLDTNNEVDWSLWSEGCVGPIVPGFTGLTWANATGAPADLIFRTKLPLDRWLVLFGLRHGHHDRPGSLPSRYGRLPGGQR